LRITKAVLPDSQEVISYKMPALKHEKFFFYFSAFKNHTAIYPPVKNDKSLVKELKPFVSGKENLKFKLSELIPFELHALLWLIFAV